MEEQSVEDDISLGSDVTDGIHGDIEAEELALRETRAVSWLRGTAITILFAAALTVSTTVYSTTSKAERSDFQGAFDDASMKLLETFQDSLRRRLRAIDGLSVDLTSFAQTANASWPGVTLPDFQMRAASARDLAEADSITLFPVVNKESRPFWEAYSVQHQSWVTPDDVGHLHNDFARVATDFKISEHIFDKDGVVTGPGPFAPIWQTFPITMDLVTWVNFDAMSIHEIRAGLLSVISNRKAVLCKVTDLDDSRLPSRMLRQKNTVSAEPSSVLIYPVYETRQDSNLTVVAALASSIPWNTFFAGVLPPSAKGITAVVKNDCGQIFSFLVNGEQVAYLGVGDLHESRFNAMGKTASFQDKSSSAGEYRSALLDQEYCRYSVFVYPSTAMMNDHISNNPLVYTVVVALIFLFASIVFATYDCLVERRQKVVMDHALQSTAIVSSLFPEAVRDRLFRSGSPDPPSVTDCDEEAAPGDFRSLIVEPANMRIKSFLSDDTDSGRQASPHAKPIADLFPHCTVLFADISGFTAWSSLRDPAQVFTLLEAVYHTFDRIARKRGVFKVETVGDSYVAVTGLPDPQEEHAVIMARFARDCRYKMNEVTRKLERTLGPDTGDLRMRFGLHSGPVTAGVLRGEKSRFQLFGDTVNTAARMESTGERDRIQISQATANLLREAGKGHWVRARDKLVHAKGKGEMQTYWLEVTNSRASIGSTCSEDSNLLSNCNGNASNIWGREEEIPEVASERSKHQRLIEYNVDLLAQHLKKIIARRKVLAMVGRRCSQGGRPTNIQCHANPAKDSIVLDEVTEVIRLPSFDAKAFKDHVDPDSVELDPAVMGQLKRYVTIIAAMYRSNPFHNFEHASHVTMSVNKLLQRVVTPERVYYRVHDKATTKEIASDLHNYTFGITSDPLTQFAVVFSALIHDVDHWGVSNMQLIKEGVPIAEKYKNKSIAEQNSVDLAWDLLMDADEYGDLQQCIFPTEAEYKRFRQVVVNVVMATDIFDRELNELRKNRWAKAFENPPDGAEPDFNDENRKATIVIEHIMQASDVAHTMQHWHVYQKWNRRLFDEMYTAYRAGRMEKDPSTFWFEGELNFFDSYIVPLAKKLKDCGVFGVASDECLNYAMNNRIEWASKGQMIVTELVSNYEMRETEEQDNAERRKKHRFARRRSLFTSGG